MRNLVAHDHYIFAVRKKECLTNSCARHVSGIKIMYDDYEDESEFAGTYVHDVEGWSDDDIYDVLDGDPEAYWNID